MRAKHLTFALLLLGAPAHAADPATVTTFATARDRLPNTVADVQLGIETHGRTVPMVRAALATGSAQLIEYLRGSGADRISTQSISVEPELEDPVRGRPSRITGYTGRMTVGFRVETASLGAVLGDALSHGANTIDGTVQHPSEAEWDSARERLAAAATKVAVAQAHAVAEAASMKAGSPRQISVNVPDMPPVRRAMSFAPKQATVSAPAPSIATEAGDTEVSASVTATIILLPP